MTFYTESPLKYGSTVSKLGDAGLRSFIASRCFCASFVKARTTLLCLRCVCFQQTPIQRSHRLHVALWHIHRQLGSDMEPLPGPCMYYTATWSCWGSSESLAWGRLRRPRFRRKDPTGPQILHLQWFYTIMFGVLGPIGSM